MKCKFTSSILFFLLVRVPGYAQYYPGTNPGPFVIEHRNKYIFFEDIDPVVVAIMFFTVLGIFAYMSKTQARKEKEQLRREIIREIRESESARRPVNHERDQLTDDSVLERNGIDEDDPVDFEDSRLAEEPSTFQKLIRIVFGIIVFAVLIWFLTHE